ncbi:MAG: hypothetical protein UW07_C0002G0016 [Candidatus Nomurabacteria bacterium GW2011_GWF2_43_8]|uniref:Uncharacterized protein n=2 Tax=Candidatus Nomuraibacteriota TaxID=1752729 RepID=A0A0G1HZU2_9BACT|nr:MAG: hypothetical protein UW02_C0023G0007 [Candidatus Nomurabacteria bacterium GW2011_GWB1_43_7]KKT25127.1 MAG: hypothetical protein UW07_C0002G0016 [Candidatus Nomurabacteria bacterium GW2011_GWF2_43_8]
MDQETRTCQNCKKDFTIEIEDFNFYEKIKVPPPTFCSECRLIRRLCWRNERSLYKRTCNLCHKRIISMYDKDVSFPVYCPECWKSDAWDPLQYGQDYDFTKPFFEQWRELFLKVPRQSAWHTGNCIDCEYANFIQDVKNVYLAYSVIWKSEDVYYSSNTDISKNIIDSYNVAQSELIYEGIGSSKNYNCQYCYWSSNCVDSSFLLDCINCQHCFGCVNLRSKNYCIWNKQYSPEEYLKKMKSLNLGSYEFIQKTFPEFWNFSLKFPRKYARVINCVNSSGDELRNCRNSRFSFNCYETENIKYAYRSPRVKNSMDVCHCDAELAYEHAFGGSDNSLNIKFIIAGKPALSEVEYIDSCQSAGNLFGCVGLRSKQYCVLNKQYTKEKYEELISKIKKQMDEMPYVDKKGRVYKYGEFFPFEFSSFGYDETIAREYFPLSKDEAVARGYNWKDRVENKYAITKKAEELPDDIKNVDDSILNEVIECAVTKKAFKITSFELQFYRRMDIPLPRIHQDERYKKRLAFKNPMQLWHRKCMKEECTNEFETSYAPDRPEIVYCERCYQQEVY